MMFLPQRWRQQPQTPAILNRNSQLTRGIIHSSTPLHVLGDATDQGLTWATTGVVANGRGGKAWIPAQYLEVLGSKYTYANPVANTSNWSAMMVMSAEKDTFTGSAYFCGPRWGQAGSPGLGVNESGQVVTYSSYGTVAFNSNVVISTRTINIIAATAGANGVKLFLNGKLIASTATTAPISIGTYNSLARIGYHNNAGVYGNYLYNSTGWFGRTLSDNEAIELTINPWQIYRAPKSINYYLPLTVLTPPSLASAIDETPSNRADYIKATASNAVASFAITDIQDPGANTNIEINYDVGLIDGAQVKIELINPPSTVIKSQILTTAGDSTGTITVTPSEYASITSWPWSAQLRVTSL